MPQEKVNLGAVEGGVHHLQIAKESCQAVVTDQGQAGQLGACAQSLAPLQRLLAGMQTSLGSFLQPHDRPLDVQGARRRQLREGCVQLPRLERPIPAEMTFSRLTARERGSSSC